MNFINILPIVTVLAGLIINLIFGVLYKTDFTALMIKSIILTIALSACGIFTSEVLKEACKKNKNNKKIKRQPSAFEAQIPSISTEELIEINGEEDEFQEVNPAALYRKNTTFKQ